MPANVSRAPEVPAGIRRVGVFPLWLSLHPDNPLASEELVTSWTAAIISDLQNYESCEWIPLQLPESVDDESRTNFDTLIGKGIEANCSGILALQAYQLDFQMKEIEIGRLAFMNASSDVTLTGSLIDVQNRTAVCEFISESHLKENNYKGPEPGDVEYEPIDSEYVRDSLFGESIAEVRKDLYNKIVQNLDRITMRIQPVISRSKTPEGVHFLKATLDLNLSAANDQRFTIQVMNSGEETETFVVKPLNQISRVVVGLKGIGSMDEPCLLNPGEWKFIRLIANARTDADPGAVVLGLFKGMEREEDTEAVVHDKMTVNLSVDRGEIDVEMKILKQDPATLRYVCQLYNRSQEEGSISLQPGEMTGGSIAITPNMENYLLAAGQSTMFYVDPVFENRSRRIEANVQGDMGGRSINRPFVFEIPPGKEMFWGTCGTSQSSSGGSGACLNEGEMTITYTPLDEMGFGRRAEHEFNKIGAWLGRWFGSDDYFSPPDHGNVPSGVRGSRVRANVESCLPADVYTDSTTCPVSGHGNDFLALVSHQPLNDTTAVFYHQVNISNPAASETQALSEPGHTALWPEIAVVKENDQVFTVWEDAVEPSGKAVALRKKSAQSNNWSEVLYLTDHSRQLVDPVICATDSGAVAVAWEEVGENRNRIGLRLSNDNSQTFMPEIVLPARSDESQSWPRLVFHPSGIWVIVYSSMNGNQSEISCATVNQEGQIVSEPREIFAGDLSCGEPRLAIKENGEIFAVWRVGEGKASEIWFSASSTAGKSWSAPLQITADTQYSEYPKIKAFGDTILVTYHAPVMDGRDLTFQIASLDRGKSWKQSKALISTSPWVEEASLELHFSLSWPRSDYKPFDTFIHMNGEKVGEILDAIPEGIYRFDIPGDLIYCNTTEILANEIKIFAPEINSADNIILKSHRLVVKRHLTQIPVFAEDQQEADRLASDHTTNFNHRRPDLSISANRLNIPSSAFKKGEKINLDFDVFNMGEAAAENVRLLIFRSDPSTLNFNEQKEKLAEVNLEKLLAGQTQKVSALFEFDPEITSSIFAFVRSESLDFYQNNNGFRLSLMDGESDLPTPLLGTDIPSLFQAPSLLNIIEIRDLEGLKDFIVSTAFEKFWNLDLAWDFDPEAIREDLRERFRNNLRERFLDRLDGYEDFFEKLRERNYR